VIVSCPKTAFSCPTAQRQDRRKTVQNATNMIQNDTKWNKHDTNIEQT